jgi:hypothetical protein
MIEEDAMDIFADLYERTEFYTFEDFAADFLSNYDEEDIEDGTWLPSWTND